MKRPTGSDKVREGALPTVQSGVPEIHEAETPEPGARSNPLKSTYNSTFIILVLAIAVILAVILLVWPSGGF